MKMKAIHASTWARISRHVSPVMTCVYICCRGTLVHMVWHCKVTPD